MVSPSDISSAIGGAFSTGVVENVIKIFSYIAIIFLLFFGFWIMYLLIQYKYKIVYPELFYDTNKATAQILRYKKDRARIVMKNGIKKVHLFWKRKYIEPFTEDMIRPKNTVHLLKINEDGTYLPMPSITFNSPGQFETVSPIARAWAILELKETAAANETPDAIKRIMTYVVVTVVLCLGAAAISVWLIMKAPQTTIAATNSLTSTLQGIAGNLGGPPN